MNRADILREMEVRGEVDVRTTAPLYYDFDYGDTIAHEVLPVGTPGTIVGCDDDEHFIFVSDDDIEITGVLATDLEER